MVKALQHYQTSIGRKQIVATTGLLLILFITGHLAGNLLILGGPDLYNSYAKFLTGLRPGLYFIEALLGLVFLIHIWVTYLLVITNIRSRPIGYRLNSPKGDRSLAAQIMPFTGSIIFAFLIFHLWDFTFTPHSGAASILRDGKDYGLYGLVYNAFSDPLHSTFYIIAMVCIGFHLSHGIESFCQTLGFKHPKHTQAIRLVSNLFGVMIGWGYSMIPVYVLIKNMVNN
ncbi:MAG: succinate dehydrogenase cytochrome b subunit [Candidatus Omnitrophica bacterium]|nr:succinate dehydrogenase cytochrome b subunit [Candidatus Omnitrophota bacterium]